MCEIVTLFPSPGSAPAGHKSRGVFGFYFRSHCGHLFTLYFRTSACPWEFAIYKEKNANSKGILRWLTVVAGGGEMCAAGID